jgi:hypothetical protein
MPGKAQPGRATKQGVESRRESDRANIMVLATKPLLSCLVILLAISASTSWAEENRATNEQFHITVSYPDSWAQLPPRVPNELFELFSLHGKGSAGCTVAANDTKIRTNTDESIVAVYQLLPQVMEGRLLEGFKNPEVIDRKITSLSNFKAISIISDGTYSTLGNEHRMRSWSLITQKIGVIYTVTCGDLVERFRESFPVFRDIILSVFIYP